LFVDSWLRFQNVGAALSHPSNKIKLLGTPVSHPSDKVVSLGIPVCAVFAGVRFDAARAICLQFAPDAAIQSVHTRIIWAVSHEDGQTNMKFSLCPPQPLDRTEREWRTPEALPTVRAVIADRKAVDDRQTKRVAIRSGGPESLDLNQHDFT